MHKPIKTKAKDRRDVTIISGLVQDSLFFSSDVQYDRKSRHFIVVINRFAWEDKAQKPPYNRTHAILFFKNVMDVHAQNINLQTDKMYDLLSLIPAQHRGETVYLYLSLAGGGVIRLTVASINITIKDVGLPWQTNNRPRHENQDLPK